MKAAKKIVLKQVLFLCIFAQTLPVLAVRPIWAKLGVSAVAALAGENVRRSYNKRTAEYNENVEKCNNQARMSYESLSAFEAEKQKDMLKAAEQRRWNIGEAVVIGLGATGAAAFFLHKRLPAPRLRQAVGLKKSVQDYYLMTRCTVLNPDSYYLPLSCEEGAAGIYKQLEWYYQNRRFPYSAAFEGLRNQSETLDKAKNLVWLAHEDFKADNNQEGVQASESELKELGSLKSSVSERILLVKAHPQFAGQSRDAECVDAAKQQARAAQEAANNTSVIAAASVVSAVNSFNRQ